MQVDTLRNAVTIPTLAVQHGPDGLFVYVRRQPNQTVQNVDPVKIGYEDGGQSVVTAGLTGHESVVAVRPVQGCAGHEGPGDQWPAGCLRDLMGLPPAPTARTPRSRTARPA